MAAIREPLCASIPDEIQFDPMLLLPSPSRPVLPFFLSQIFRLGSEGAEGATEQKGVIPTDFTFQVKRIHHKKPQKVLCDFQVFPVSCFFFSWGVLTCAINVLAAFVHALHSACGLFFWETSRRPLAHALTKATASQIALLGQSQATLFIHYLFSGCAVVALHCEEKQFVTLLQLSLLFQPFFQGGCVCFCVSASALFR